MVLQIQFTTMVESRFRDLITGNKFVGHNSNKVQMSLDLRQMFPGLKETDATNLAWGGLEATDGFQQTIAKDAVKQGSYQATNLAYSKGISGTRCK